MSSCLDKGQTKISVCILRTHGTLHCKRIPGNSRAYVGYGINTTRTLHTHYTIANGLLTKNLIAAWMVMVRPALLPGMLTLALRAGNLSRLTNYITEEKRSRKLTYITRVSVSF